MLPAVFWLHDFSSWKTGSLLQRGAYALHCLLFILGCFMCVAGTYSTVQLIIDAYAEGTIGKASSAKPLHIVMVFC